MALHSYLFTGIERPEISYRLSYVILPNVSASASITVIVLDLETSPACEAHMVLHYLRI
jgi:hypothetical protein